MGLVHHRSIVVVILLGLATSVAAECDRSDRQGKCHDKIKALNLKLVAIGTILVMSVLGISLPLFTRAVPVLQPDRNAFVVVKCFASGVILATGYMHVMPDSWDDLTSECLPVVPWRKYPITTLVAMVSVVVTMMADSLGMSFHKKRAAGSNKDLQNGDPPESNNTLVVTEELQRHRMIAQVLEMGIIVHSVIIGLAMGASDNPCTIAPLIAALCFHQFFEGMGLGGCILQADYGLKLRAIMVIFFATTTPFGIGLGIGLSNIYSESSPTALIVEGLLNACSAGLLQYMAMVDLLAADFFGPKLQANVKLQLFAYVAVFFGAGLMALMAKWA